MNYKNTILVARTSNLISDSRCQRIVLFLSRDTEIIFWGLNRNNDHKYPSPIFLNRNVKFNLLNAPSHGSGLRSLPKIIYFQVLLCLFIFKNRSRLKYTVLCDLDTSLLTSLICFLLRIPIIYDIFDFTFASRIPSGFLGGPFLIKVIAIISELFVCILSCKIVLPTPRRIYQLPLLQNLRHKITHVPNSPSTDQLKISNQDRENVLKTIHPYLQSNKLIISYFGTLQNARNLDWLVESVSTSPNIILFIGGTGPLENYFRKLRTANIHFWGSVPYDQVILLYSYSHLLFAGYTISDSNNNYASPNKLWEAMVLGKPLLLNSTYLRSNIELDDTSGIIYYDSCSHLKTLLSTYTNYGSSNGVNYSYLSNKFLSAYTI
jgi:glycosyltransferase involved in cell wall biosynthesis